MLHNWVKACETGTLRGAGTRRKVTSEPMMELSRLRAENTILRKATAYVALDAL